jgi:hypothetical protein
MHQIKSFYTRRANRSRALIFPTTIQSAQFAPRLATFKSEKNLIWTAQCANEKIESAIKEPSPQLFRNFSTENIARMASFTFCKLIVR